MRRLGLLVVLVSVFAACGDDDGGSGTDDVGTTDTIEDTADAGDTADDADAPDDADAADVSDDVTDVADDATDVADATDTTDAADTADTADTPPTDTGSDVGTDVSDPDAADAADADTSEPPPLSCSDIVAGDWDEGVTLTFDPAAIAEEPAAFDLGIQSGSAHAENVLLWTHIADSFNKTLYVWRDGPSDGEVVLVHAEDVAPGPAGYTHVRVDGLAPCTWYSFAFFSGTAEDGFTGRSRIGTFKTAHPLGSLDVVRVGASSCTSGAYQPWTALELTAEQDIDLFVNLGDQSYNDDAETLSEYRAEWRRTLTDPGYRAIHARTSHLSTWDDHEVTNNWDPETISDARRLIATDAYFETLAIDRGPSNRLWHSYRWGDTVEFFVTDNRGERLPSTRRDEDAQYISPEQMAWLQEGLLTSDAHFKVVFSSVPITNMPGVWDLSPEDRWEGYPADRARLLDFITDNEIENVWFLGGDFHIGWVGRVEPEGPASNIWEIAVGPGGNGPNPLALALSSPQFPFKTDGFGTAFMTTLEFDPVRNAVRVIFAKADGEVIYDEWLGWGS